jgi:hypothetical protein
LAIFHSLLLPLLAASTGDVPVTFDRDVRPILSDKCFECHGPDTNKRKAKLRLDREEGLFSLRDGRPVVAPGSSATSELYARITHSDLDSRMPPAEFRHSLNEFEIDTIRTWIDQGAVYEGHWAWSKPMRPDVPAVADASWIRNPIDAFVLARLEAEGLSPSPVADARTLARRLTVDLTGLPANADQVEAFERGGLVEALLASPHYGERMAQHWLDLVRYADTVGYHGDQEWRMWPYRDHVIHSFNANQPFDEFTIEQIAGDLIHESTNEQQVAASYNRLNMITFEGGSQAKEFLLKYASDRVRNLSTIWLGATMNCAECHEHKFDPYSMEDFYRLSAFFADIKEEGVYTRFQEGSVPPERRVVGPEQETRLAELTATIASLQAELERDDPGIATEQASWEARIAKQRKKNKAMDAPWIDDEQSNGGTDEGAWNFVTAAAGAPVRSGERSRRQTGSGTVQHFFHGAERRIVLGTGDKLFAWVHLDQENPPEQVMLQFHVNGTWEHRAVWGKDKISFGGIGTDTNAHRQKGVLPPTGVWVRLEVDPSEVGLSAEHPVDGIAFTQFGGLAHWDVAGLHTVVPSLAFGSTTSPTREAVFTPAEARTDDQSALLRMHFRTIAPSLASVRASIAEATAAHAAYEESLPLMLATVAVEPREVRVLPRGNWMDDSGEVVQPGVPSFLFDGDVGEGERADRLDLAGWLVSDANPLAARAFVNRIWKLLFGEGLARDPNDLGNQGARPTHPELLDWLAVEFIESGWDVKALLRTIVSSNTYRQSSDTRPDLVERDPYNEFLARQTRWRHDAEFVRDGALAVSGLLAPTIGGPSVKPYQPAGHWRELNFPMRTWKQGEGDQLYRRSLYTFWCRTFLHPAMDAFDAPNRENACAKRNRSNTPQQALVLLNDPGFVEAARALAEAPARLAPHQADEEGIGWIWSRALARKAGAEELSVALALLQEERIRFGADPEATRALLAVGMRPLPDDLTSTELAAWTQVSRLVLNLHETVTRN